MTEKKCTKRALLSSVFTLFLCVAMFIGTTFAWFTDTASSKVNKIQAGTLDVKLLMHDGSNYVDISANEDPIFGSGTTANANNEATLWEPGKTQVAYLAIENAGNLDLKYSVKLNVKDVEKKLYEVMEYAITPDAKPANPVTAWTTGTDVVEGAQDTAAVDVTLAKGATHYFALSVHMKESAGNAYQGGQVDFDLTVLATQVSSEEDSFGNSYDATASYPAYSNATKVPTTAENIYLQTNEANPVKATVPSEVVAGATSVTLKHDGIVENAAAKTITVNALELVDQNGNVIDLTGNTTKKLTITIPVSFPNGTVVAIAHDGTQIATAVVADGKITYNTYHLCDVTLTALQGVNPISAAELKEKLLNGTMDKDYYVTDSWTPIVGETSGMYEPIVKKITIDGKGHTISGLDMPLLQFNAAQKIYVSNLTIKDSNIGAGTKGNYYHSGAFLAGGDNAISELVLDNCHTVNVNVKANNGTASSAGSLVGYCYTHYTDGYTSKIEIKNCTVTGGSVTNSYGNAAGIVGFMATGIESDSYLISNCKVENCKITGEESVKEGQLVGTTNNGGRLDIKQCVYKGNAYGRAVGGTSVYIDDKKVN